VPFRAVLHFLPRVFHLDSRSSGSSNERMIMISDDVNVNARDTPRTTNYVLHNVAPTYEPYALAGTRVRCYKKRERSEQRSTVGRCNFQRWQSSWRSSRSSFWRVPLRSPREQSERHHPRSWQVKDQVIQSSISISLATSRITLW